MEPWQGATVVALAIAALLITIMVPASFHYVDRNNFAFKKNTATNEVDQSTVYTNGRYWWGLARAAVNFPANYQKVDFTDANDLDVFTDGGQTVSIGFVFWYRLDASKLAQLYTAFGTSYHDRILGIAQAELRNAAPQFVMNDYMTNRANVSQGYFQRLSVQLLAKAYVTVEPEKFLLQYITLPAGVLNQKLTIFTVTQSQTTALYVANATQIRLETLRQVAVLNNTAALITQAAQAQATRMVQDANSNAFGRVETERGRQLQNMIASLNVTTANATEKLILLTLLLDATNSPTLLSGVGGAILQSP